MQEPEWEAFDPPLVFSDPNEVLLAEVNSRSVWDYTLVRSKLTMNGVVVTAGLPAPGK